MNLPIEIFLILAPFAISILLFTTILLVLNDTSVAARILATQLGLIALWLIFNTTQVLSGQPSVILIFSKATYLSVAFLPTAWYCFAVFFIGVEPHKKKYLWLMVIFPLIILVLNWTNDFHHLIWKSYRFEQLGRFLVMHVEHGVIFWVFAAHSYLLLFLGSYLIIRGIPRKKHVYSIQALCLVIGALIPLMLNTSYLLANKDVPKFDFSPLGYAFGSLFIAIGMFFFKLFSGIENKFPELVSSKNFGLIFLNELDELTMVSDSVTNLSPLPAPSMIGTSVQQLFPDWPKWIEQHKGEESFDVFINHPRALSIHVTRLVEGRPGRALIIREATNLLEKFQHYKLLSEFDGLLNIFNRRHFLELAESRSCELKKNERIFSIIFFDIDHFKLINDNYGHFFGDEILLNVTNITKKIIRKDDLFGRYGGDEFIVFLSDLSEDQTWNVANRLRNAISDYAIETQGKRVNVSISVGVVCSSGYEDTTLSNLINIADKALYEAKRAGRNTVQVYSLPGTKYKQ